jgi:hypothetical protein
MTGVTLTALDATDLHRAGRAVTPLVDLSVAVIVDGITLHDAFVRYMARVEASVVTVLAGLPSGRAARLVCDDCRREQVVARPSGSMPSAPAGTSASCKDRGFCPSCMGRRMSDTAAHLVDRVLPDVRIRQWVLSLPIRVRLLCAFKPEALTAVVREFTRAIFAWQRRRARKLGFQNPRCGAVTAIQRFGSAADLNTHLHTLVLDGIYTDAAVFHALSPPTAAELARLTRIVAKKVGKALVRMGFGDDDAISSLAEAEPCVAALVAESVAFPKERLIDPDLTRPGQASAQHAAEIGRGLMHRPDVLAPNQGALPSDTRLDLPVQPGQ